MTQGLGMTRLIGATDRGSRAGSRNDDQIAVDMATARHRVGVGLWIIGRVQSGFALIEAKLGKRPESLEDSLERLASVSPHLLDDIGIDPKSLSPVAEDVFAAREQVRTKPVQAEAKPATPEAAGPRPVVVVDRSGGFLFGQITPAE